MFYNYNQIVKYAREYENSLRNFRVGAVAILDTGCFSHMDLYGRIIDFKDMIDDKVSMYDDNGHGTHICGIVAGNGRSSGGKFKGISGRCPLVAVKVLDKQGNGNVFNVLRGFEYVLKVREKYNIKIVNISMGAEVINGDEEMEQLIEGVENMWEQGLIVMVAAGNNGPQKMSITAPGNSKKIITVGACDDDLKAIVKVKNYSGRGPTCDCVIKPDIVTVGSNIMSLKNTRNGYMQRSGTSMATAVASGLVGIFMEKHYDYSPKELKRLLIDSAVDMGKPVEIQGNGALNIEALYGKH